MEKNNCVEMVRKIRDTQYAQIKNMSKSEYLAYVKKDGREALERIRKLGHKNRVVA